MLLLMGFGVVSTMAFTVDPLTDDLALWDATAIGGQVSASAVDLQAYGKTNLKVTITLEVTTDLDDAIVSLVFLDSGGLEIDMEGMDSIWYAFPGASEVELTGMAVGDEVLDVTLGEISTDDQLVIRLRDSSTNIVERVETVFISIKDTTGDPADAIDHTSS